MFLLQKLIDLSPIISTQMKHSNHEYSKNNENVINFRRNRN
jgi:hypothetical protein